MVAKLEALRLADEFGVSMTPVRDCLNQLVGEGLVDFTPGEGYRVALIGEQAYRDILRVNLLLLLGAIDGVWSRPDREHRVASDSYPDQLGALFVLIAEGSGNGFLVRQIERISERICVFRQQEPSVLPSASSRLRSIQECLDGDKGKLRTAVVGYHEDCLASAARLTSRARR